MQSEMVGVDLSHTHLLPHVPFWPTETMLVITNVSAYSIITHLEPLSFLFIS